MTAKFLKMAGRTAGFRCGHFHGGRCLPGAIRSAHAPAAAAECRAECAGTKHAARAKDQ